MLLVLGATLAALHSPPSQAPDTARTGAYLDETAREMVLRARERRERVESDIDAYQVTARQRIYAGLRVAGRDRTLYTRELATRIDWRRGAPGEVHVLGAREAVPVADRSARLPDDLSGPGSDAVDLAFDPDRLHVGIGIVVQRDSSSHESSLVDPLGPGSEEHYRFAAGDSLALRLPDGRSIHLRELRVIPRRSDFRLLRGSLWLDRDTHGTVRGVFTLARPFDLVRDARGEVPGAVRALGAVRARLDRFTMEYALVQGRWWLPHRLAVEATAEAGLLGSFPVRYEQSYGGYGVQGRGEPALPGLARPEGAVALDSVRTCRRGADHCRSWQVHVPLDTAALLASDELQPSLARAGEVMATNRELAELGRVLQRAGAGGEPQAVLRLPDLSSFRMNRVEGPSLGVSTGLSGGAWAADGSLRVGLADREPAAEVGVTRPGLRTRTRLGAYRRLSPFDLHAEPATFGSALNALLLGRDEADYLRATGMELTGRPVGPAPWEAAWRVFGEHQHPVRRETDFTLVRAWDETPFPEVRAAARADQVGMQLALRTATDDPYGGVRRELRLTADAQAGTFAFGRGAVQAGAALPVGPRLALSLEAAAGTSAGDVPPQGLWYLGGPTSVRGFRVAAAGGEAFWRARAEVARGQPAFRLALFSDAGWTGARDAFTLDPLLVSAGAGISTLDGLIRVDVARALRGGDGWRADLYLSRGF